MKLEDMHFTIPKELEASAPPEARGQPRDHARLLVIHRDSGQIEHRRFYEITDYLKAGDVVVLNISSTIPAALPGVTSDGQEIEMRLSSHFSTTSNGGGRTWQAVFKPDSAVIQPGLRLAFGEGALPPLAKKSRAKTPSLGEILGRPIKYDYVTERWNLEYYQTTYAAVPGSSEMPSAGRAFTPELLAKIEGMGVALAQIILHTGVSNIDIETEQVEQHTMYEEWYQVSPEAAETINAAR